MNSLKLKIVNFNKKKLLISTNNSYSNGKTSFKNTQKVISSLKKRSYIVY